MKDSNVNLSLDKTALKLLLRAVDKYNEKHVFGSPVEQEAFDDLLRKIHIALFELTFLDT